MYKYSGKRIIDVIVAFAALMVFCPIILGLLLIVFVFDKHNPLYIAPRVGRNGKLFSLIKIRTMKIIPDLNNVDTTSSFDPRITAVGKFLRKFKLDELPQFVHVLTGEMSLVGPRPNVEREVALYTTEEQEVLSVLPGITDLASIAFVNLGEVIDKSSDPNLDYNQYVRPWKSELGLLYVKNLSLPLDVAILVLTALVILSKKSSMKLLEVVLKFLNADEELIQVSVGKKKPYRKPPPGAPGLVWSRDPEKQFLDPNAKAGASG